MIMLNGAIFDHDGLMFDTEKIWQKNWNEIAAEMGKTLPEQFKYDICGTSGQYMLNVIQKYYQVEDGTEIMQKCVAGVHRDEAVHIDEKEGLRKIIELFKKNGVKMAVASSSPKSMLIRNLENAGIAEYFDVVVSGTEIEHGKPFPDLFLKAADELGIAPENCYVFEDAYNGVRAGHAAGCTTVMIPDMVQPDDEIRELADAVCSSLREAADQIASGLI